MDKSFSAIAPSPTSVRRAATVLMVSILLSRVIGFFREWVLARTLGASDQTDVYYASFTIPDFLNYALATGALSISFIPILSNYRAINQEESARRLFRVLATYFGGTMVILVVAAECFAENLAHLIAPGFTESQIESLACLLRIILPSQVFFYLGGLATSVLHVQGRFWLPAISPIIYNLAIILFGVLFHRIWGVSAFSWGVLAGSLIGHGLLIGYGAYRCGFVFRPLFRIDTDVRAGLKKYWALSLPIMLGFSLVVTDEWITKYLASSLEPKLLSWLSYARTEMRIPIAVIGQAAGIASFPYLSRLWSTQKFTEYGNAVLVEIKTLFATASIGAVILYVEALPITRFIYGGGRLETSDIIGITGALEVYAVGVFFWTAQILISRAFYASGRTWLPSVVGSVLSILIFPVYGHLMTRYSYVGLAAAGTLGIIIYTLVLGWYLYLHLRVVCPAVSLKPLFRFFVSWSAVALIVGVFCHFIRNSGWFGADPLSSLVEVLTVVALVFPPIYGLKGTRYLSGLRQENRPNT